MKSFASDIKPYFRGKSRPFSHVTIWESPRVITKNWYPLCRRLTASRTIWLDRVRQHRRAVTVYCARYVSEREYILRCIDITVCERHFHRLRWIEFHRNCALCAAAVLTDFDIEINIPPATPCDRDIRELDQKRCWYVIHWNMFTEYVYLK